MDPLPLGEAAPAGAHTSEGGNRGAAVQRVSGGFASGSWGTGKIPREPPPPPRDPRAPPAGGSLPPHSRFAPAPAPTRPPHALAKWADTSRHDPGSVTAWDLPGNRAFEKSYNNCSQLLRRAAAGRPDWRRRPPLRRLRVVIGELAGRARPLPRLPVLGGASGHTFYKRFRYRSGRRRWEGV